MTDEVGALPASESGKAWGEREPRTWELFADAINEELGVSLLVVDDPALGVWLDRKLDCVLAVEDKKGKYWGVLKSAHGAPADVGSWSTITEKEPPGPGEYREIVRFRLEPRPSFPVPADPNAPAATHDLTLRLRTFVVITDSDGEYDEEDVEVSDADLLNALSDKVELYRLPIKIGGRELQLEWCVSPNDPRRRQP